MDIYVVVKESLTSLVDVSSVYALPRRLKLIFHPEATHHLIKRYEPLFAGLNIRPDLLRLNEVKGIFNSLVCHYFGIVTRKFFKTVKHFFTNIDTHLYIHPLNN